jgi:hypothetical protein
MSESKINRSSLVKRVLGVAAIGAAVGVGVPVLAGATQDETKVAAPFVATDGAERTEVGIDPRALTAADGAALVRHGSIVLAIRATGPGTISATGTSQVGNASEASEGWVEVGRESERITEPASVVAEKAGLVQLTLRLTPAARAAYAAGADEPMLLRIDSSGARGSLVTYVSMG